MISTAEARRNADIMLAGIEGIHVDRLDVAPWTAGGFEIEVLLDGLDASLHEVPMTWRCTGCDGTVDDAAVHFGAEIALQRARMSARVALGLPTAHGQVHGISHMLIDGALLAYETHAEDIVRRHLEKRVRTRHEGHAVRQATMAAEMPIDVLICDGDNDDPRPRVLMPVSAPWGSYDGRTVRIRSAVPPDTVMAALPGRRIYEIIGETQDVGDALREVMSRCVLEASPGKENGIDFRTRQMLLDADVLDLTTAPRWTPLAH